MSSPLPCPFCGTIPTKKVIHLDERYAYADEVKYLCHNCGCFKSAIGDTSKGGYADNSTVEKRALESWNRRYNPLN